MTTYHEFSEQFISSELLAINSGKPLHYKVITWRCSKLLSEVEDSVGLVTFWLNGKLDKGSSDVCCGYPCDTLRLVFCCGGAWYSILLYKCWLWQHDYWVLCSKNLVFLGKGRARKLTSSKVCHHTSITYFGWCETHKFHPWHCVTGLFSCLVWSCLWPWVLSRARFQSWLFCFRGLLCLSTW